MSAGLIVTTAGRTHPGLVRKANEDDWVARPEIGLWAVADGMGGHERGDVASAAIIAALARLEASANARAHLRAVEAALQAAHAEIQALAAQTGATCGSTVAALLAFDRHYAVLWAGDSRVYRLRAGCLEQLTRDHSLVQMMVDSGELAPEAASVHPWRNRITRALGMPGPLELDGAQGELLAGDLFLLCTDGLTGHLPDAALMAHLAADPDRAADALIQATLAAGATDNVTAIVVAAAGHGLTWPGRS